MTKYEHEFQLRVIVNKDGSLGLRLKDENMVIARNVKTGYGTASEYDFELGYSSEFEEDEKMLRKQRKALKELLKKKFSGIKAKINA